MSRKYRETATDGTNFTCLWWAYTMRCVSAAAGASVRLQLPNNWCMSHRLVPVETPLWKCETHILSLNFTSLQGSSGSIDTDRQTDRQAMRRSHVHSVSFSCARAKPSRTTYFLQPNDTHTVSRHLGHRKENSKRYYVNAQQQQQ